MVVACFNLFGNSCGIFNNLRNMVFNLLLFYQQKKKGEFIYKSLHLETSNLSGVLKLFPFCIITTALFIIIDIFC